MHIGEARGPDLLAKLEAEQRTGWNGVTPPHPLRRLGLTLIATIERAKAGR